jgi:serine/threonine protein phosphatase PrpC
LTRPLRIEAAGQTHTGRVRAANEDSFAVLEHLNLFMVADGMGGHSHGEVASEMAIHTLEGFFDDPAMAPITTAEEARARLVAGVKLANRRILRAAQVDRDKHGMGTTFAGVLVQGSSVCVAHVGDSRVYRFRDGQLDQLTQDHAALREVTLRPVRGTSIVEIRALRHVLTRALGLRESVEVDARIEDVNAEDIFLICSDGLAGVVDEDAITGILGTDAPLDTAAWALIERANAYGGPDNVTCVLVRWTP